MTKNSDSNRQQVIRDLAAFVFFHLGSDATVRVEQTSKGISVRLEHRRIQDFQFTLCESEIESFFSDRESFEEFLLDHLTKYRRS